jgi:hypothetical protein
MRLFFFGSLRDHDLLELVLGCSVDDLAVVKAILHEFKRRRWTRRRRRVEFPATSIVFEGHPSPCWRPAGLTAP